MSQAKVRLFVFLADAVASESPYRPGARHALLLYGRGVDLDDARHAAVAGASGRGWHFIEIKREKETSVDVDAIADDTLQSAAAHAIECGHSLVVYKDEIAPDA